MKDGKLTALTNLPAGVVLTDVSMQLPVGTTEVEWDDAVKAAVAIGYGYWWWLADAVYFAKHHFAEPDAAIERLAAATGNGVKYLMMIGYAARKYAVRDRVKGLSISHHLFVIHKPPQVRQRLLQQALKNGWSTRTLRDHVTPPKHRMAAVVLKVPMTTFNKRAFRDELQAFVERWNCRLIVHGKGRPSNTGVKIAGRGVITVT